MTREQVALSAKILAKTARQEDVDEWVIGTGLTLEEALRQAVMVSPLVRTLCSPVGLLLCMWGCYLTEADDMRQVWFVASRDAPRHAFSIHRHFKSAVAEMHRRETRTSPRSEASTPSSPPGFRLRAFSYWRNVKHHRWLVSHGFDYAATYLSPLGVDFHSFIKEPPP